MGEKAIECLSVPANGYSPQCEVGEGHLNDRLGIEGLERFV